MGDPVDANQYVQQAIIQLVHSSVNQTLAIKGGKGLEKRGDFPNSLKWFLRP